jgi:hypothetical protein
MKNGGAGPDIDLDQGRDKITSAQSTGWFDHLLRPRRDLIVAQDA